MREADSNSSFINPAEKVTSTGEKRNISLSVLSREEKGSLRGNAVSERYQRGRKSYTEGHVMKPGLMENRALPGGSPGLIRKNRVLHRITVSCARGEGLLYGKYSLKERKGAGGRTGIPWESQEEKTPFFSRESPPSGREEGQKGDWLTALKGSLGEKLSSPIKPRSRGREVILNGSKKLSLLDGGSAI